MNFQLAEHFMIFRAMKYSYLVLVTLFLNLTSYAQDAFKYHRSSLYSVLIKHENKQFNDEIVTAFKAIPIPDKFDNHNLSKRIFNATVLQKDEANDNWDSQKPHIDEILQKNAIARRLVAKWFNQSKSGTFDSHLLVKRGFYDANAFAIDLSERTIKGHDHIISDAGNELIRNTYVIVHDIQYYDRRETGKALSKVVNALGAVASAIPAINLTAPALTTATAATTESIAGFKITVTSYLYRLNWDEKIEGTFYKEYYTPIADLQKMNLFNKEESLFSLTYVGNQTVYSGSTTMKGVNKQEEFFIKVCTRAIDKAIAQLQKEHEEFRVKTPLLSTEPITAKIGIKEDITEDSRFEVLEVSEDNGKTSYKRVGVIKPAKGKIWDNRYLAEFEDENKDNKLTATLFEKVSGSDFYPGMLIREINK